MTRRAWIALAAAALHGCAAASTPPDAAAPDASLFLDAPPAPDAALSPDAPAPDDAPAAALEVHWTPCELATAAREPAECATVQAPARWDAPDGATVALFVKRYRNPRGASRGQLWFLQGGPGGSARDFDGAAPYLARWGVDLDSYMLDQRGTGLSSRLGCPEQEAPDSPGGRAIVPDEWPGCLAAMQARWGADLAPFTVTNTARDLGELVRATRGASDRVFVYAVSYGTYLANRYLELYPEQPAGVVLDSIVGATGPALATFSTSDERFDAVARRFFAACGADAFCAAHLGPDPWARLAEAYDRLEAGACPAATAAGLTRAGLRRAFAALLYNWNDRLVIPALAFRLWRCAPADQAPLAWFGRLISSPVGADALDRFSTGLFMHVALSELWDEPTQPLSHFVATDDATLVSNGVGPRVAALHDIWPRASHDGYFGRWAATRAPVLMLGGGLDPATPLEYAGHAREAFAGPAQTLVAVPAASHGVLANSPVLDARAPPCGATLVMGFVRDPAAPLDTACVGQVQPIDFHTSPVAARYLGTSDLWGD